MVLIWSRGPLTSFTPALPASSLIEADSSKGLLLGKSTEFVLSHLVGGVVFVPRHTSGGGSPGVYVDYRVVSRCLDMHLRVDCPGASRLLSVHLLDLSFSKRLILLVLG